MEKRPNIKLTLDQGLAVARDVRPDRSSEALASILGVERACLLRRSVDARRKSDVHFVVTVGVGGGEGAPQPVVPIEERPLPERQVAGARPVVVGTGPAGLFAALELAEAGLCPLVIERGAPVDERMADIERFHRTRVLDTASNVQFGEGGAGTFSDGKLSTGKNSPQIARVFETFVAAGAPSEILWQAKPHIGTDVLGGVVKRIRERIIACGGEVRFHTQLVGMRVDAGGLLRGITLEHDGISSEVEASRLIRAFRARHVRPAQGARFRTGAQTVFHWSAHRARTGLHKPGPIWTDGGTPRTRSGRLQARVPSQGWSFGLHVLHVPRWRGCRGGKRTGRPVRERHVASGA